MQSFLKKSYRDVFNYGIAAGVVTSKDLQNKGWPVFPAVVPFVETRFNSRLNVRMIAVPPWGDVTNGEIFLQLLWDID